MHRIDSPGATAENKFTEGDPGQGVEATEVDAEWLTAVQEEIAGVAEAAGLVLDKENQGQLLQAIVLGLASRIVRGDVALGIPPGASHVQLTQGNTTAPGTLNISSGGALHNAILRLIAGGGGEQGWEFSNSPTEGNLRFLKALDANPDGSGTWALKAYIRNDGELFFGRFFDASGFASIGNGLILQWGTVNGAQTEGSVPITLPLAFPNSCLHASGIGINSAPDSSHGCWIESESIGQAQIKFYVQHSGAGANTVDGIRWFAIGR